MSTRKRILFFVPLPPPVTGAAMRNQSLLDSPLIRASFDIQVVRFNFARTIKDIGVFSFGKVASAITRFFQLFIKVIQFRPHLVYFNLSLYGFALYRDTVYAGLFKAMGCRLLYHLRTQGVRAQVEKSRFKKALFGFVFRKSHVICLSAHLGNDIRDVYSGKPFIVNNGIEDVSQRYPRVARPTANKPGILYMGHLAKFKGVPDLIEALAELARRNVPFQATLVGEDGDLRADDLRSELAGLQLSQDVLVRGFAGDTEKYNVFSQHDLFVLPTHFEAFPGVILEAMQFGMAIVATREGAIPEIVDDGETGLLYEKGDVTALADRIQRLIEDRTMMKNMGILGRKKFESMYTLGHFERSMKEVFERVAEQPN